MTVKDLKKKNEDEESVVKKRRWHPGTKAVMDIRRQQRTSSNTAAIPMAPFARLVRQIVHDHTHDGPLRVNREAMEALQEASECYLRKIFFGAYGISLANDRNTLQKCDVRLSHLFSTGRMQECAMMPEGAQVALSGVIRPDKFGHAAPPKAIEEK